MDDDDDVVTGSARRAAQRLALVGAACIAIGVFFLVTNVVPFVFVAAAIAIVIGLVLVGAAVVFHLRQG